MQGSTAIRIQTRFKPDIHQWLKDRAKQNNRSLNGELMEVLKEVKDGAIEKTAFERGRLEGIRLASNP